MDNTGGSQGHGEERRNRAEGSTEEPEANGPSSSRFERRAESEITAALCTLVAPATEAILEDLEALRVAFDVRSAAVQDAIARPPRITPAALSELTSRLARAAAEETDAQVRTARGQAVEQAQSCLKFERAEANRRFESMRVEMETQREADQLEKANLQKALDDAKAHVDSLQAHGEQLLAARAAQDQLLEQAHAQLEADRLEKADLQTALDEAKAHADSVRAHAEQLVAARATQDRLLEETRAQVEAERLEKADLQRALDGAKAHADALQARGDQLAATSAAQDRMLAETRAQIDAARHDAERVSAAHQQLVADLRAELETAQAEARRARDDTRAQIDAARHDAERTSAAHQQLVTQLETAHAKARQALLEAERVRPAALAGPDRAEDARRYAHLLAAEIKRYHDAGVASAPESTVSERLKEEIARCRRLYAVRVPAEARSAAVKFFDEALVEALGATAKRESEATGEHPQPPVRA